jgi:hypothetical protein
MKFDLYLKRQKVTIEQIVKIIGAESYDDLNKHFRSIGIKCPPEDQLEYAFKKDVEERPVAKSSNKKKRVSSSKSNKSKANDSSSSGGSGSTQRVRKSPAKRQRKRDSNKVEPIQPASGSEDTK